MDKEELAEFIRENLKVRVDHYRGNDWESESITVSLILEEEEFYSSSEYIYR